MLNLIQNSKKILVCSHLSPDPDAVCSTLLTVNSLQKNFKNKEIVGIFEDYLEDWSFLKGFENLQTGNIFEKVKEFCPDLIIICDANNFSRISRLNAENLENWTRKNNTKILILDHHEAVNVQKNALLINDFRSSACEQVFISFSKHDLQFYPDFEETLLMGILSDTNRFMYENPFFEETLEIVNSVLKNGLSIEKTWNKFNRYRPQEIEVLQEFLKNLHSQKDFNYTFLSDEFISDFEKKYKNLLNVSQTLSLASSTISNQFLRSTGTGQFGFLIYKDVGAKNIYKGSFRSNAGVKNVSELANKLGGGGHKWASGFRFESENIHTALEKVLKILDK